MSTPPEIFILPRVSFLRKRLGSPQLLNGLPYDGIKNQIKKLKKSLSKIQDVLANAEVRQVTESAVKDWLQDLQDLVLFDLEDALDDLESVYSCDNLDSKLKKIDDSLTTILEDMKGLSLTPATHVTGCNRSPTSSVVIEGSICGRDKEREDIVNLLIQDRDYDNHNNDPYVVIPIVGMGGLGKTTLAQLVYNDERVKSFFDVRSWVCVSEKFDVFALTKTIFDSVTNPDRPKLKDLNSLQTKEFDVLAIIKTIVDSVANSYHNDLNSLQTKLRNKLTNKKFLIVLDDVWNENYNKWYQFRTPFGVGASGSKFIVTTRDMNVASMMRSASGPSHYGLTKLDKDDCVSLLCLHALDTSNFNSNAELKSVGELIADKCDGLPLAAKTLGGLLRSKTSLEDWEDVLHSKIWEIPREKNDVLPALRLSYHYLPVLSKLLFAYCSIFSKDCELDMGEIVLLWMLEGFLGNADNERFKSLEELGRKEFDVLLSRSFFQQSSVNHSKFVMHDLLNDLAQYVAGSMCFILEAETKVDAQKMNKIENAHHIAFTRQEFVSFERLKYLQRARRLRSFLSVSIDNPSCGHISRGIVHDMLPKLHYLRVLFLSGYSITELPDSIGDLKHLRYIDLSGTLIEQLPDSVGELFNLHILLLYDCERLRKVPTTFERLLKLRHFDAENTNELHDMPSGLGKLTNLQTLSKFCLGGSNDIRIRELESLSHLRGSLSIIGLQNVKDVEEARDANLSKKEGLDKLILEWTEGDDDGRDQMLEKNVLDLLQPHSNLKRLEIKCYGGKEFSTWVGDASILKCVVDLKLIGCKNCTGLPSLGRLPLLKYLRIEDMRSVKVIGDEFFGVAVTDSFPCIENLRIEDMPELEEWFSIKHLKETCLAFPLLSYLSISNCPKLRKISLPRLGSLRELELRGCGELVMKSIVSLASSLNTLRLNSISGLFQMEEGVVKCLGALEFLKVKDCKELESLWKDKVGARCLVNLKSLKVKLCDNLVRLTEEETTLPGNIDDLRISRCPKLKNLPSGLKNCMSLQTLLILDCARLKSLPFSNHDVPPMLESLRMEYCDAFNGDEEDDILPMLKYLFIEDCEAFSVENNNRGHEEDEICHSSGNVSMIKELVIGGCTSLTTFPIGNRQLRRLEYLNFYLCTKLIKEDIDTLIESNQGSLEKLFIKDWFNPISLPPIFVNLLLVRLELGNCPELECFPENGLPLTLRTVWIENCKKLKSLPNHMQSLKSLKDMHVIKCPSLQCISQVGLPPNIKFLELEDLTLQLSQLGLKSLSSLKWLSISGFHELQVLLLDGHLLPASLRSLFIKNAINLETISMQPEKRISLVKLKTLNCPKLRSLPELLFPKLFSLKSWGCPQLEERCEMERGDYWPSIINIPRLKFRESFEDTG